MDKDEPPLPGRIRFNQALHFAEAMARGEKYRSEIAKTILKDKSREVIWNAGSPESGVIVGIQNEQ